MLTIIVEGQELFDEAKEQFLIREPYQFSINHSLVSLSKWESIFQKPFLKPDEKSRDEVIAYIQCMCLGDVPSEKQLLTLGSKNMQKINEHIDSTHSATTFPGDKSEQRNGPREVVTSELIYYWMVAFGIPFEAENWHLNRLFNLIRIANIKNSKPKKMSKSEMARERAQLNAQRRADLGTSG